MICVEDVIAVHKRISGYLHPCPLQHFPALDVVVGNGIRVFVKPEVLQPTRSFKVRNAFGGLTSLTDEERQRGVIAASTGNLGQGLAYAGKMLGVPVTICVRKNNDPQKNAAIVQWGARLVEHGDTYDEAHNFVMHTSKEGGPVYISTSGNKGAFAGAATLGLEIFSEGVGIDRVVHPIGSGTHATGTAIAGRSLSPATKIVGMQAANAATVHDHWHGKTILSPVAGTIADAISLGPEFFSYSVSMLRGNLDDLLTATEDEIINAMRVNYKTTGYIVEPAGAIGLAGILANRGAWSNETIVIDLSGGNLNGDLLHLLN